MTNQDEVARQFTVALMQNWFQSVPDKKQATEAVNRACDIYQRLSLLLSKMEGALKRGSPIEFS